MAKTLKAQTNNKLRAHLHESSQTPSLCEKLKSNFSRAASTQLCIMIRASEWRVITTTRDDQINYWLTFYKLLADTKIKVTDNKQSVYPSSTL